MNLIPGLSLRATEEAEILGIDDAEIGEFAYDYVELTREVLNDTSDTESKYSARNTSAPIVTDAEKIDGPRPDIEPL